MQRLTLVLAALAVSAPVLAQDTSTTRPARRDRAEMAAKFAERFRAADKDGDGALTRAEAEVGMPRLARHFDEIDSTRTGRITQQQVGAFMAAHAGQRGTRPGPAASGPTS
ncbi:calcium-binding protein [Rivibacter subsaxonicus]|uniref:EF hand domain-containing protein n=1 Tax=Rivibacter subsaxonicus TaxID=457575 RepID=A0A4Q7W1A9_9BURK|nr:calcium-binding protein [Rivibacter subsaxonicus]RZU02910.1 EF hand domain-containing protein [Rivibacter subsaxonicus]